MDFRETSDQTLLRESIRRFAAAVPFRERTLLRRPADPDPRWSKMAGLGWTALPLAEDIGGLGDQIEVLRDSVELPYIYPEVFEEHQLAPPKGILLYGPPGCGKTLIAKAVANSLAKSIETRTGKQTTPYFLNVKGPELLNKYVGETEHKLREVFNYGMLLVLV